jgi:hypothetical protein
MPPVRRSWPPIIKRANALVQAFGARFGRPPTLRRLHYELATDMSATELGYLNVLGDYKTLSELTARGRRDGSFPDLAESVRALTRHRHFNSADEVREHIREIVRVDRMQGQPRSICMVVEKAGSRDFLSDWFDDYGVLVTSTNGYSSQTLVDKIRRWQGRDGRRMLVLYAGDHDASGEDIDRDFQVRLAPRGTHSIEIRRVALLPEHVEQYGLVESPFDKDDSRAPSFIARHGGLFQVELDALDPDILRGLFEAEFEREWDKAVFQRRLDAEPALLAEVFGEED